MCPALRLASSDDPASPLSLERIVSQFSAAGLDVRTPALEETCYLQITSARTATCDLTITSTGHVTLEYRPRDGTHTSPAFLADIILSLLSPGKEHCHPAVARHPGPTLKNTVACHLTQYGLAVSLKLLDLDQDHFEAFSALTITHPARPDRGTVTLTDDAAVLWQCRTCSPAGDVPALSLTEITTAISTALAQCAACSGLPQTSARTCT